MSIARPPEIAITLGPCDEMRAEVFVRFPDVSAAGGRLVGTLVGPRRGRDTTLPTTSRLVPLPAAPAAGPVSRGILTEPAFWTPDLPNLYRVEADLEIGGLSTRRFDTLVGMRRLGVRGRSFWLDGRRWVPRAVVTAGRPDLPASKAAAVGVVAAAVTAADLAAADETGVAMLPLLGQDDLATDRLAALAIHPSAMLAIVAADVLASRAAEFADAAKALKGTMLIGYEVDGGQPPPETIPGFDFIVVTLPAGGQPHAAWRSGAATPLVAWRHDPAVTPATARAACDSLQRDLAAWGLAAGGDRLAWDWAGYLVGSR